MFTLYFLFSIFSSIGFRPLFACLFSFLYIPLLTRPHSQLVSLHHRKHRCHPHDPTFSDGIYTVNNWWDNYLSHGLISNYVLSVANQFRMCLSNLQHFGLFHLVDHLSIRRTLTNCLKTVDFLRVPDFIDLELLLCSVPRFSVSLRGWPSIFRGCELQARYNLFWQK